MQFTEISFAIFFSVVFIIYWLVLRRYVIMQNILLLASSYLFYGWWDWRFLGLIIATTVSTFVTAMGARSKYGFLLTVTNIVLNIGILAIFKYLNFFSENLQRLFNLLGWNLDWFTIDVLLPVGISFYTFQAIAYSVDVYRKRIEACHDPVAFATFIAYFPQLVAGPIERAAQLLPQIERPRTWSTEYASSGLRMVLYGILKKVCVADMLAIYADRLFLSSMSSPLIILIAGLLFTLQIYCDFSSYSEIARGTSRLLGIELMANFRFPLFSRNILEFWQRWHISLMLWFKDYVYIPLGGNRHSRSRTIINTFIIFLLSGMWHGASWNFIIWGAYWAIVYTVGKFAIGLSRRDDTIELSNLPSVAITFGVVSFGFFLFRCNSWHQMYAGFTCIWIYLLAFSLLWVITKIMCRTGISQTTMIFIGIAASVIVCVSGYFYWTKLLKAWWLLPALMVTVIEWRSRNMDYPLQYISKRSSVRLTLYWICIALIILSEPVDMTFIYFQF